MRILLNLVVAFILIGAIGCGKKSTNGTTGDKSTDTKGVTDKVETVEYKCAGMHCSGCEETITTEVKKTDGVKDVKADSKSKIVTVSFDANKTSKENISKSINAAGYDTEISKSDNKHDCETDMKKEEKEELMAEKVDFDKHAESYEKQLTEDLKFFGEESKYFAEYKIRIVEECVGNRPINILEYGCGIGMNLQYLAGYFPNANIFGSDISAKSIEVASKNNSSINFFLLEDEEIARKKDSMDLIFISNVFHHIEPKYREKAIKNIFYMLKPKGNVFFFEHNPFNPVTRHIVNTCVWDTDAILLKPKESLKLFKDAGFHINRKHYTLYFPAFLKFLRPVEKAMFFIPMGGQYYIWAEKN